MDFLNTNASAQAFQDWKNTVPSNPLPVLWRMVEISELFQDNLLREQLRLAIDMFLTLSDTSSIVTIYKNPDNTWNPYNKRDS